jgi:uncharacterized protein (DUF433 family)
MATLASIDIGSLITKSPDNWDGKAVIAGTRVPVMFIANMYDDGLTPEHIAEQRYLSLAQVYAAITYYLANKHEIDKNRTDYDKEAVRFEKEGRRMRSEGKA